jgi:hypothetical protein
VSPSVSVPVLVTVAAVAVGFVGFTATNLWRQIRLRRHLRRLRTPLEAGRE